jgi:hypothetical protein
MSNPKYSSSISINALVKLIVCTRINNKIGHEPSDLEPFDYHQIALTLHEAVKNLNLYSTLRTVSKDKTGDKKKNITKSGINAEKSWPVISDINEDIETAIREKELPLNSRHTDECNEKRIKYMEAIKWCNNYSQPQYVFDIKPVKLNNIYLTLAALLQFLKDSRASSKTSNQEYIAAEIETYLKQNKKKLSGDTIKRILTESNNILNPK